MKGGRPLWFLLAVVGGWGMFRGIALYREYRDWHRDGAMRAPAVRIAAAPSWPQARVMPLLMAAPSYRVRYEVVPRMYRGSVRTSHPAFATIGHLPGAAPPPVALAPAQDDGRAPAAAPPALLTSWSQRSRLAGSAWLIARDGGAPDIPGSQLGGSQAGIRATYAIGANRRLALSARLSAPLSGQGREAAIGFDWQPIRVPLHILAERRIALDGGRGGMMAGVVGGFGPREMLPGVRLEGYAQAGVVLRDRADAFADGAVRASLPLARIGGWRIDAGGGLWGGVQRGAARLDIGPSLGLALPLGTRTLRLAADWRQRIAGPSRPNSGPALSLGTDF